MSIRQACVLLSMIQSVFYYQPIPTDDREIQEKLTAQIANTLQEVLQPRGVAVVIEASHQCMTTRGVHKSDVAMVTSRMLGAFRDDASTRREFLSMIQGQRGAGGEG